MVYNTRRKKGKKKVTSVVIVFWVKISIKGGEELDGFKID